LQPSKASVVVAPTALRDRDEDAMLGLLDISHPCVLDVAAVTRRDQVWRKSDSGSAHARYKRNLLSVAVLQGLAEALVALACPAKDSFLPAYPANHEALLIYIIRLLWLYVLLGYFEL
jgi:hypothetical protein